MMLDNLLKVLLVGILTTVLMFAACLVVFSTNLRFLPIFRYFALELDVASDQQELLRHLPIDTSLQTVKDAMDRNGFFCQTVSKGQRYNTGYFSNTLSEPSNRGFLACYRDRYGLPCRVARRVEIDYQDDKMTKLTVHGEQACL